MTTLKVKWYAKQKGTLKYSFDELDITEEQWGSLSDQEKEQYAINLVNETDETIVYGNLDSFEVIDGN